MMYRSVESLYRTPGTNVLLYVNHTGVKIKNLIKTEQNNPLPKKSEQRQLKQIRRNREKKLRDDFLKRQKKLKNH